MSNLEWLTQAPKAIDQAAMSAASEHQQILTKPAGSLGQLEALAIRFAGMQGQLKPQINNIQVSIFAADHGLAGRGVSAFPQEVTAQMVSNFAHGGAAVSVLSKARGADFEVVNLGTVGPVADHPTVVQAVIASSTADCSQGPAMTDAQLALALNAGRERVLSAQEKGAELFIGGEMGIGNTSAASMIAAALTESTLEELVGPGTGLDNAGVRAKQAVLEEVMALHAAQLNTPLGVLQSVGGFEIAALCGAYLTCAQQGIPALVDGFICTAAALLACRMHPEVQEWLVFAHNSAEPGHRAMLQALQVQPLLNLGMRLGEGSGAVLAVDLLRSACLLHGNMATFADAGVADKSA
ncbi:nicotinate-nucleotide--dimethylbenzimidazole phosphoribosyltransferase [Aliamphritea ceti]|uniref:nicotinate-nucleotide--dimethylbenzimidazole phosphoribosyltransferase n=1 Tax=Aliamphritea ceti TaxID=1524258 RepID=UPI0021C39577|nr:nicotinate-nucleotide--dimethylbenzimidazole phosphoribosyltransferase [Aliamphritea ceti]